MFRVSADSREDGMDYFRVPVTDSLLPIFDARTAASGRFIASRDSRPRHKIEIAPHGALTGKNNVTTYISFSYHRLPTERRA